MMEELKVCPFCGADSVDDSKVGAVHVVHCSGCVAEGPTDLGESGAAELWNTRPIEDALRAEVERLQEKVDELDNKLLLTEEDLSNMTSEIADKALRAEVAQLRAQVEKLETENNQIVALSDLIKQKADEYKKRIAELEKERGDSLPPRT